MVFFDGTILQTVPLLVGLGVVIGTAVLAKLYLSHSSCKSPPKTLQDPEVKYALKLARKEEVSHDTRRFTFELPSQEHVLGLPVGQHINLSALMDRNMIIRSYTPVTSDRTKGYMELVVKVYFKNVHPKHIDGGKMSQYLNSLKIGDTIDVRGPKGNLQYVGRGQFSIKFDRKTPTQVTVNRVNLIAGGTGITPMLQLVNEVVRDEADTTQLALLFANQTEADILLREELDALARVHPTKFRVWYTIDRPEEGWQYSKGFVDSEMVSAHLFPASDNTLTLLCGPPPMIDFACKPSLDKLGYNPNRRFAY